MPLAAYAEERGPERPARGRSAFYTPARFFHTVFGMRKLTFSAKFIILMLYGTESVLLGER